MKNGLRRSEEICRLLKPTGFATKTKKNTILNSSESSFRYQFNNVYGLRTKI